MRTVGPGDRKPLVDVRCTGGEGVRGIPGCGWRGRRVVRYVQGAPPWLYTAGRCPRCGLHADSESVRFTGTIHQAYEFLARRRAA